jgi:hypothetical protein
VATLHHLNQLCMAIHGLATCQTSTRLRVRPTPEQTLQAEAYLAWVKQEFLDEIYLLQHADFQILLKARQADISDSDEISRRMFEGMDAFLGQREDWDGSDSESEEEG